MTELLYLRDCYAKEFTAKVVKVEDKELVLDKTLFYPTSGGQPNDTGTLIVNQKSFVVENVKKNGSEVIHIVNQEGIKEGDLVKGLIDWDRRYKFMRMHTASHLLSTLIHNKTGALITGNQLGLDESRDDFNVEEFDREKLVEYQTKLNEILKQDIPISIKFVSREEAEKMSSIAKLAKGLHPDVKEIRLIDVPGIDLQACGGTHLSNINEIGQIKITKLKNKGANNRRVYFELE